MAVAIPLLLTATGASAAIGAAVGIGAGMVTTIATVAFTVTGISEKINKAAASVFGEDLVKIGNIFGAGYMAFSGGLGSMGGAETATAGAELSKAALDGTTAFGANSVEGAFNLSDLAGAADSAADAVSMADEVYAGAGGAEAADIAASRTLSPMASGGQDLLNGTGANGPELAAVDQVSGVSEVTPVQSTTNAQGSAAQVAAAPAPGATAPRAAGTNAAGANAAAPAPAGTPPAPAGGKSWFSNLFMDKNGQLTTAAAQAGGGLIQGVGQGIGAASKAKADRKMFEEKMAEERRRMGMSTGLTFTR